MADFNVKVTNEENSAGLRGASRGVAAPEAQQFATNTSGALKTKNLNDSVSMGVNLFQTGVKFADDVIKQNVDLQSREQVDQINDEFGLSDAVLPGKDATAQVTPSEINSAEKNLQKLTQARLRGSINENSYWARVESVSRQLRAKYPGHRDYIDQRISSIAGGDPANNIIRNLQQEAEALAKKRDSDETRRMGIVEDYAKQGFLLNGWEKMSTAELINNHAPMFRSKVKLDQEKAQIELAKSRNEATDTLVNRSVVGYTNSMLDQATSNLINPNNESFSKLSELLDKGTRQGSLSPDEQTQVRAQLGLYKSRVTEEVMAGLRRNYGETLTAKTIQDAQTLVDSHMSIFENAIVNKDYGILSFTAHRLEDMKTNDQVSLSNSPFLRQQAALTSYIGPQAAETVMQWSSNLATARDKSLFADSLTDLLVNNTEGKSIYAAGVNAKGKTQDLGKFTEALVNANTSILHNPASTPEATKAAAQVLYGADNAPFLRSVPANKQEQVFNRLVNDTTYQRVKQLRDQGHQDVYDNYIGWVKNSFPLMFRGAADSLSKSIAQSNGVIVSFNPESNQFFVSGSNPLAPPVGPRGTAAGAIADTGVANVSKAINRMNSAIRGMAPILKEQGTEPMQFLGNAFQNLNIDDKGNLLGSVKRALNAGGMSKLGRNFTPEEMAVKLAPGTEFKEVDPTTGIEVSRYRPGDTGRGQGISPGTTFESKQVTPQQGDTKQMEELSALASRTRQDIVLLRQLATENPDDTEVAKKLEDAIQVFQETTTDLRTLQDAWVQEFTRTKK